MNNVSFTGKADIIFSKKLYDAAVKNMKEVCPFPNYYFKDGKFVQEGFSQYANTCTEGFVHNGTEGFMFHIAPEPCEETTAKFLKVIERLKKGAKENLTAFLTGGIDQMKDRESFKAFDKIANVLDNDFTDLSIIWGKKTPTFVDNMAAIVKDSKIIMNPSHKGKITDLEELYSIVEVNPKHKIIFDV